jgi:hypothetical protein
MPANNTYTSEQLDKIRSVLSETLGELSGSAVNTLATRVTPKEKSSAVDEKKTVKPTVLPQEVQEEDVDVGTLVKAGKLQDMMKGLKRVHDNPDEAKILVDAILNNKQTRAFHLLEVLKDINQHEEIVDSLISGIVARKAINSLIDALSFVENSSNALRQLVVGKLASEGRLQDMMDGLKRVKENKGEAKILVEAILINKQTRAFHLLEVLKDTKQHEEIVDSLVSGIVSRKAINSLIDALSFVENSPNALRHLAEAIVATGKINQIIRAIGTAPKGLPDAEIIWTVEILSKGTLEQIMEAVKLLEVNSPGMIILVAGLVNRDDIAIESLVRAIDFTKSNPNATTLLATAIVRIADAPTIVTLLEKHISDSSYAAEILVTGLVNKSTKGRGKGKLLSKASRCMRSDSTAGQILAMGIVKQKNSEILLNSYNSMKSHQIGRKMIAVGIVDTLGKMQAMKILGSQYFKISKFREEVSAATEEASSFYQFILADLEGRTN